jgi:hypothetical protein
MLAAVFGSVVEHFVAEVAEIAAVVAAVVADVAAAAAEAAAEYVDEESGMDWWGCFWEVAPSWGCSYTNQHIVSEINPHVTLFYQLTCCTVPTRFQHRWLLPPFCLLDIK